MLKRLISKFHFLNWRGWIIIAVILAVSLNLAGWFWLQAIRNDFLKYRQELASLSNKSSNLFELKKEYEKISSRTEELSNAFLSKEKTPDFISLLEKTGARLNVGVDVTALSEVRSDDMDGNFLNLNISLTGSYNNLVNFIAQLENIPFLIALQKIEIFNMVQDKNLKSESNPSGYLKANLELRTLTL